MKSSLFTLLSIVTSLTMYSQEYIKNGAFDEGLKHWKFQITKQAENGNFLKAKAEPYNKPSEKSHKTCAKIRVITADRQNDFHTINLNQKLEGIKKNKNYKGTFWAKSNIGREDVLLVQVFSSPSTGSKIPYSQFFSNKRKFQGDGKWHKISFEFSGTAQKGGKGDVENLVLRIGVAGRMGVYYIDDVKIERI